MDSAGHTYIIHIYITIVIKEKEAMDLRESEGIGRGWRKEREGEMM